VSYAQDPGIVDIFKDGFYGGLAGALVGTAALAFTDEPEDHLNYIAIGAGVGVMAGTAYGIYSATQAMAEIEGSRVVLNLPVPQVVPRALSMTSKAGGVEYQVALLRIRF
jgi:uncharacterized membrane protein YebE (DUF533 family)